jgi:glycine hydroxymethyltransferase
MESQLRPWLETSELSRIDELMQAYGNTEPTRVPALVAQFVRQSELLNDRNCVNLYAGTNIMDPQARLLTENTIGSRPSLGQPGNKYEMGLEHAEALEVFCLALARRVFHCSYVEFRVFSGSMANLYAYMTLAKPGDTMLALPEHAGGHATHRPYGAAGLYGLRIVDIPWSDVNMTVDLDRLADVVKRERPRIILVGGSLMLLPFPLQQMRTIADTVGAHVVYDAAHVSGLIAGNTFQQPLQEGAHLMTLSTYKSLGGPAGGLLLTNGAAIAEQLERVAYPGLTANFDLGRIAALAVTLAGSLQYGAAYAQAMCANAQALAQALASEGLAVVGATYGFTRSHHVALAAQDFGGGTHAARQLEECLILASGIDIPGPLVAGDYRALRLGTQEVTRWGMQPQHMPLIARAIADRLLTRRSTSTIRAEIEEFRMQFQQLHFVLDTVL